MLSFSMNGYRWRVLFDSPYSPNFIDRTGKLCVATTDPRTRTIYLSNRLAGDFLHTVLIHELGHCALFSYNLLSDVHNAIPPQLWIEAEEWICNLLADYGEEMFEISKSILAVADEYNSLLAG